MRTVPEGREGDVSVPPCHRFRERLPDNRAAAGPEVGLADVSVGIRCRSHEEAVASPNVTTAATAAAAAIDASGCESFMRGFRESGSFEVNGTRR